ncbi:hypothetical protein [Streptomyces macrosporus]|uniref:Uncharacterized protein n=1 Tax=Streptomyces macrosporus TaxID=44032 RepID=A0ABP5XKB9_9ACTN
MLTVRLPVPTDAEVREALPELADGAWLAVREGDGRSPATTAWVAYGEPAPTVRRDHLGEDAPRSKRNSFRISEKHGSRAHADRAKGVPPVFTVRSADDPLGSWCVVRPDPAAPQGAGAYSVTDAQGNVLGRLTRGRSPLKVRRAWTIELPETGETVTGYRGTLTAWSIFVLLFPLWVLVNLVFMVIHLLEGEWDSLLDWDWGIPRRTKWRARSLDPFTPVLLERRGSRYRRNASRLDARVAYAQMVLDSHY